MSSIEDKIINIGYTKKNYTKKLHNKKTGETKLEKNNTSTVVDESGLVHAQPNPMDKQQTKGYRSTSTDLPEDWTLKNRLGLHLLEVLEVLLKIQ